MVLLYVGLLIVALLVIVKLYKYLTKMSGNKTLLIDELTGNKYQIKVMDTETSFKFTEVDKVAGTMKVQMPLMGTDILIPATNLVSTVDKVTYDATLGTDTNKFEIVKADGKLTLKGTSPDGEVTVTTMTKVAA